MRQTITFRQHRPGDMGWIVHRQAVLYHESFGWNEELEALMAQITADFIRNLDSVRERCWIAERGNDILGSVFCVKKAEAVAQLRLLYVEPAARGLGLGTQLVNECVAFARGAGYRKIVLWTNSVLEPARRIYEHAGFKLIASEKQHSFGKDVVEETWELSL
jgi:GNAT superfamily N-acetyltransferase